MFFRDPGPNYVLDMTVTNRSNDAVWGMLGANYVHFSFLQEYMAARLRCGVGRYWQFTNNLHIYTESNSGFKPDKWLAEGDGLNAMPSMYDRPQGNTFVPLVKDAAVFEKEMPEVANQFRGTETPVKYGQAMPRVFKEPFLNDVVRPALMAFAWWREADCQMCLNEALEWAGSIEATDWRIACTNWLNRRIK